MISTRQELCEYLSQAQIVYHKNPIGDIKTLLGTFLFPDSNYQYLRTLYHYEYHYNNSSIYHKFARWYYAFKLSYWRRRCGIELGPNVAGPSLHIPHGKVVISAKAKIGCNCKILSDVTIGGQGRYDRPGAPIIGNRVFIGSGARIIGNVQIADDVVVGANAVIIKDIIEPGITVAGIPAQKISSNGSYPYLNRQPKSN